MYVDKVFVTISFILEMLSIKGNEGYSARRYEFEFDPNEAKTIIGVPSMPSHLPKAVPILPGHTLIRPTFGMLKSSVKFPHRELEDGAGVYGSENNLGIRYIGRNERLTYSDFRRSGQLNKINQNDMYEEDDDDDQRTYKRQYTSSNLLRSLLSSRRNLGEYIMIIPEIREGKPSFSLTSLILDLKKRRKEARDKILERINRMRQPKRAKELIIFIADPNESPNYLTDLYKEDKSIHLLRRAEEKIRNYNKLQEKNRQRFTKHEIMKNMSSVAKNKITKLKLKLNDIAAVNKNEDEVDENDTSKENAVGLGLEDKDDLPKPTSEKTFIEKQKELNIVSINDNAIDFDEFMRKPKEEEPAIKKDKRNWWFYNQIDWKKFDVDTDIWARKK